MELICIGCRSVSHVGETYKTCSHCGSNSLERFDPCKHGRLLVGSSNSWLRVKGKWADHPFFEEVSQKLLEDNCASAPTHLNVAIERLLKMAFPNQEGND